MEPTSSHSGAPLDCSPAGPAHRAVEAALEHWQRRLLDLSMRNRLLNFRPAKVSTVAVVDELPVEVFRMLAVQERPMRFRAAEPVAGSGAADDEAGSELDEEAGEVLDMADADELIPPGEPGERHLDDRLQTSLSPERLDQSLRRISEQAVSVQEEQGVNTLFLALGMLHYYEAEDSNELRRAPLLLLPVELKRRSAGSPYTIAVTDDDPVLNPALTEYLRRDFDIRLPELPEITDDLDPAPIFAQIASAVAGQPRWRVTNEIVLGLFSFQKFVMYKDIERNRASFSRHRLLETLASRRTTTALGLPEDVERLNLDKDFAPEATYQVVDADASQIRAIAAVGRGHDLVMEGPPGTGKSQTITNLIAHALSAGKTVLFVAEKMAALSVVQSRLKAAGLGDFCLELHSGKANKRAFMKEIARSWDASNGGNGAAAAIPADRLREVRHQLGEYVAAVHATQGPLGMSPFKAYGAVAAVASAPPVRLRRAVEDVTAEQLDEARRALGDLAATAAVVGDPASHAWRDTTKMFYGEDDRADLAESLAALVSACDKFLAAAPGVAEELGFPAIATTPDARRARAVAGVLERSPGAPVEVLENPAWNAAPPLALELVSTGTRASRERASALARFRAAVLDRDHELDAQVIERLHTRIWRMLSRDYRRVRRAWLDARLLPYSGTLGEQVAHMRAVDALRRDLATLARHDAEARQLFGAHWRGADSDWNGIRAYVDWVVEFRQACVRDGLGAHAAERASRPHSTTTSAVTLLGHAETVERHRDAVLQLVGWPAGHLAESPVAEIRARAAALVADARGYVPWTAYLTARAAVSRSVAEEMLALAEARTVFGDSPAAFERAFLTRWLEWVVQRRPALLRFHALTHEQRVREFRDLDRRVLLENRAALTSEQRHRVQGRLRELQNDSSLAFLRGQMARQRGHAALRRTLKEAHDAIKAIKPCFMMSPLSVAQFVDPEEHTFDLVVFDEASQLTAEDAVGAIVRGRQLVVVGDPKQLPPTSFFAVQSGQVTPELNADGDPVIEDMESILEQFLAAGISKARLKWHYRSRHESLIAFSNVNFYDGELLTFPSADTDTRERGLQFVHVPDGVYEGAGLNRAEARRVVDAIMTHARTTPELSLGVGTFNLRQQIAIQDELERRRRADPSLEEFFAPRDEGAFFVKNLENIQGDDRDVILLSVTYAKGPDGRLRHNFGPINGENGWRRLNVLTTRSRLRMRVFSSMRGEDIDLTKTQAAGARYLREFLIFAEQGRLSSVLASASARTESPFERALYQELMRRGVRLVPQVGIAGYRVDFGVLDDEVPGRFVCGIECDGAAYHSAETARDRDRLRQEVLEGLGWSLLRVWSTDWFKDPGGQVERLLTRIEEQRQLARERRRNEANAAPTSIRVEAESDTEPVSVAAEEEDATGHDGAGDHAWNGAGGDASSADVDADLVAAPYLFAQPTPRRGGVLDARISDLISSIGEVLRVEAPLHEDDLASRVALSFGDQRVGARIGRRIAEALSASRLKGVARSRGAFVWGATDEVSPRSRAGTAIPAERIAVEEWRAAVVEVLERTGALPRERLATAVRSYLGFNRRGRKVEEQIANAIEGLMRDERLGEISTGICLRASGNDVGRAES